MPPRPKTAPTSHRTISRQLRAVIQARGMTAYTLGQRAGIDPGMIQRFLNEERDIRLDTLDRLADVLGLRLVEGTRSRGRPAGSVRSRVKADRPASLPPSEHPPSASPTETEAPEEVTAEPEFEPEVEPESLDSAPVATANGHWWISGSSEEE